MWCWRLITGALRNAVDPPESRPRRLRDSGAMARWSPGYVDETFASSGRGQAISKGSAFRVDLPVREGNAVVRLSQIGPRHESNTTAGSLVRLPAILTAVGLLRRPDLLERHGNRVATGLSPPVVQFVDH